ncbi:Kinesin-like protein kif15 [Mortierella sp. NVP85]|nr:Kinesin-like protein kif15 [Mortierella sp. NVP85]
MQGPSSVKNISNHEERGIIPRCIEYLFRLIAQEEQNISSVKYLCRASYIEIYNEMIYDLLDRSTSARATREDIKRGVYVDGATEETIHSPEDAYRLFEQGAANRHTSATSMNRESSRSHTVLTLTIQSMDFVEGINHIRESRFNLVDLAGSERQKQASTEGARLKEAGNINKSLLCLGSVINALGEIAQGHSRHVAIVNEDVQGNVNELRAEIQRLKSELELKRATGITKDVGMTNKLLLDTLSKLRTEQEEHLATAQKGFMLDDACKAREKQIQSAQLIIKFKESALVSYRKGATNAALEAEKAALQEEIAQLRRQLDFHPEMLKVKAENMSLREMLQKYEKYQSGLEAREEQQKKDKEYFHSLSEKLQELGRENEALRTKIGSMTPKGSILDIEEIDFPKMEGIEDIMQESPPKVRDADRRFSNDMKSLLQRVTKSRQAEYRRLSGNLGITSQTDQNKPQRAGLAQEPSPGTNLSNDIAAQTDMHSEDTVEVTLLKRDLDRLKDEKSVLIDEKANLEREFADSQFQLITMEKCLEQATNHAEQLGRDLQSSRHALSNMEKEASQKIMELNREMQEQVELMEKMRQASIQVEEELDRQRESHREVEQKLKITTKDLDDQRQRLIENQKEYDHQVEYNMKRINEFQQKESKWDVARRELLSAKEELEKQVEQEKTLTTSTRSELEKEHLKLSEEFQQLVLQKSTLEESQTVLEKELDALRKAGAAAAEEFQAKSRKQMGEYEASLKAEETKTEALESELRKALESLDELKKEFEAANQASEAKTQEANQTLHQREQQLEKALKAVEAKHKQDLADRETQVRSEVEQTMQTARQSLIESHEQEIQRLQSEVSEQNIALEEARNSLKVSIERADKAMEAKQKVDDELSAMKDQYRALEQETDALKKEKARLETLIESSGSASEKLSSTLEEQKQELSKLTLRLQQEQWEKERLETTKAELQDKISEMARKVGETEHKLEQARDGNRMLEMEYKTVQDELEYQLNKVRNELILKTNENTLNEEYKRKFRELRAQFADLGPAITERQQQGFHEREQKRIMELERMREELNQAQTRSAQLEANLALAQEVNEQLLVDSRAGTAKIAEEIEKRLKEVEVQRRSAEREVELALETVAQKSAEYQDLEEQAMFQRERIRTLEEELSEERSKTTRLESSLSEGVALKDEKEASEKEMQLHEAKQKLKLEQLVAQQQLLVKTKEEQQAFIKQHLERRDKTRALFEGLAKENGKLMEQVRDLGLVNESMMKHQNSKQKLQYHVKIKQENNELRYENQRLMFKTIELEEKLGNKENADSLRNQVREMHGDSLYQSTLDLELTTGIEADALVVPTRHSPSQSPALSSNASSGPNSTEPLSRPVARPRSATPAETRGLKRRADPNEMSSRKKQTTPATRQGPATPAARPRSMSSSSLNPNSTSTTNGTTEAPLGPRARAKAAADAALAAKTGRRFPTPAPAANRFAKGPNAANRVAKPSTTVSRATSHDGFSRAAETESRTVPTSSFAPSLPVIGSASAERALARARMAAASTATVTAKDTAPTKNTKNAKDTMEVGNTSGPKGVGNVSDTEDVSHAKEGKTFNNDRDVKGTTSTALTHDPGLANNPAPGDTQTSDE